MGQRYGIKVEGGRHKGFNRQERQERKVNLQKDRFRRGYYGFEKFVACLLIIGEIY